MRDIFEGIERKSRAIWLVAIVLATYNILRLLSIIASPYSVSQIVKMDIGMAASRYLMRFQEYLAEESTRLQMSPDSFMIIIFCFGCVAAGYVVIALFLGMRKNFARYIVALLIAVEIIIDIAVGIQYSILPSKISIVLAIFLLLFLRSPHIAKEFR